MRRDQIDFSTETNSNKDHAMYGKTAYHAMMKRPFPEGADDAGAALGRSWVSHEAAYEDLRARVKQETGVDIGPLRDVSVDDVFLAVHRMLTTQDVDLGSALEEVRKVHDLLVEHRRRNHEEQEARLAAARRVWLRRYVIEYTQIELDGLVEFNDTVRPASLDELKEVALLHSDDGVMGWEHVEAGKPWVTEITTVDGALVWSDPDAPDYPPFEEEE